MSRRVASSNLLVSVVQTGGGFAKDLVLDGLGLVTGRGALAKCERLLVRSHNT